MTEPEKVVEAIGHETDDFAATTDRDLQLLDSIEEELDDVERRLAALDEDR